MRPDARSNPQGGEQLVWPWLVAFLIAGCTHALWLFAFQAVPVPTPADQTSTAQWTWWPEPMQDDETWSNYLTTWSPTLFALPDTMGFSRTVIFTDIAVRPPVDRPPTELLTLDRVPLSGQERPVIPLPDWAQVQGHRQDLALALPAPERVWREPDRLPDPLPRVEQWVAGADRPVEDASFPSGSGMWGDRPWRAEAVLHVNAEGSVVQVMLATKPDEPDVTQPLLRALYAWRWAPVRADHRTRVWIAYPGAAGRLALEVDE